MVLICWGEWSWGSLFRGCWDAPEMTCLFVYGWVWVGEVFGNDLGCCVSFLIFYDAVVCLDYQNGYMESCGCLPYGGMESLFEKMLHGHVLHLVDRAGTLCGYGCACHFLHITLHFYSKRQPPMFFSSPSSLRSSSEWHFMSSPSWNSCALFSSRYPQGRLSWSLCLALGWRR